MASSQKAAAIDEKAWDDMKRSLSEIISAFGAVLVLPALIAIGFFFGIQAGFIRGAEKTIELFKKVGSHE